LGNVQELAASLDTYGLLQPIVVRRVRGGFMLIAGRRRLEAARLLGWSDMPAIVRAEADDQAYLLTLVENMQRLDLTPREEATALEVLVREHGWSTRRVAAEIKRSQAYVSKRLRVFEDPLLAPAVLANKLGVSVAEELLSVSEPRRLELLPQAIEQRWELHDARSAIKGRHGGQRGTTRKPVRLARRAREFRMALRDVAIDELTPTDQRELRLLFTELAMLARARPGRKTPVIPPLPAVGRRA